jgi:hypothetical protein
VAHVLVRHRMLIFVAKILWSTAHAPQNVYFGAQQKRFSLLVMVFWKVFKSYTGLGKLLRGILESFQKLHAACLNIGFINHSNTQKTGDRKKKSIEGHRGPEDGKPRNNTRIQNERDEEGKQKWLYP